MKIHHLNTGTFRPIGGRLVSDGVAGFRGGRAVSHCLLIETAKDGLVLVDTGPGASLRPAGRMLELAFNVALRPDYGPVESPSAQVKALGFDPTDVRHILLTHLDPDHIGGLVEFPWAQVHLSQTELDAATAPRHFRERLFAHGQWAHGVQWAPIPDSTETWKGIPNARTISGLPDGIVAVALPGHTEGHTGYAVATDAATTSDWILHGGDSHFSRLQIAPEAGHKVPLGIKAFYRLTQYDAVVQRQTLARLVDAHASPEVRIICSHDPRHIDSRESTT